MKFTAGAKESLSGNSTYRIVKGATTAPAAAQPSKGYSYLNWGARHATEPAAARHEPRPPQEVRMDFSLETYIERCRTGHDATIGRADSVNTPVVPISTRVRAVGECSGQATAVLCSCCFTMKSLL